MGAGIGRGHDRDAQADCVGSTSQLAAQLLDALLKHPSMQEQQVICPLMCTCLGLQQIIAFKCRGQLKVHCKVTQEQHRANQFATWIGKHAGLLRTLELDVADTAMDTAWLSLLKSLSRSATVGAATAESGSSTSSDASTPVQSTLTDADVPGPLSAVWQLKETGLSFEARLVLQMSQQQQLQRHLQCTDTYMSESCPVTRRQPAQLQLSVTTDAPWQQRALARWLLQHASSNSLDVSLILSCSTTDGCSRTRSPSEDVWSAAEHHLVSALQQAADTHVHLPTLTADTSVIHPQSLPQLSASGLETLTYRVAVSDFQSTSWLSSLTSLHTLHLEDASPDSPLSTAHNKLLQPLSALSGLSCLTLNGVRPGQTLYVPGHVKQLDLVMEAKPREVLDLHHLTALTYLEQSGGRCLSHQDVLPPNVEILQSWHCKSVKPILGLHSLVTLVIGCYDRPNGMQLQLLSRLPCLARLQLEYFGSSWLDAAAVHAWKKLPLRSLTIREASWLSDCVVCGLGSLHSLESFTARGAYGGVFEAPLRQLAAAMQRLTGLQALNISGFTSNCACDDFWDEGRRWLQRATTRMPALRQASIDIAGSKWEYSQEGGITLTATAWYPL